jgi:hypothetical protein
MQAPIGTTGLMAHGRFAEANSQLETARRLDLLALIVEVDLALPHKYQRDFDAVITVSKNILQRDPNYQSRLQHANHGLLLRTPLG